MSVFRFLPLKRMFTGEMEENYMWFNAAFGQVETAFANFMFWHCRHELIHTLYTLYTCTY